MLKKIPIKKIINAGPEIDFSKTIGIRDLGDVLHGKPMNEKLHRHNFYFVLAVKNGKGQHDIDFTAYPVNNHNIFFIRPGQVHELYLEENGTGYLLYFKSEAYLSQDNFKTLLLRKASRQHLYQMEEEVFNRSLVTLEYIFKEYKSKKAGYEEVIKANLSIFFTELSRHSAEENVVNDKTYMQERLDEFLELLEQNMGAVKQVRRYADMMNLSQYQLNIITKTTLGKTSSQLIQEHIILEAKRYLLATPYQVSQIAFHLGYEDVSYFIRLFKKHTGQSPESFRHKYQ